MVETLIFEIQDIAANVGSDEDIYAQTDDIINRYFKYETLASFTIGPYWRKGNRYPETTLSEDLSDGIG